MSEEENCSVFHSKTKELSKINTFYVSFLFLINAIYFCNPPWDREKEIRWLALGCRLLQSMSEMICCWSIYIWIQADLLKEVLCFRSQLCLSALLCFLWSPAKTPPMLHPRFKNAPLLRPEKAHLVLRAAPRPLLATPPRRELGLPKCFCSCSLSWSYGEGDGEREGGGIST